MFRSTQIANLFPLSILLLLVIAIGSTGQSQSEKAKSKSEGSTTARTESAPLVVERGSDARIDSKVTPPSDPVVVLLRLLASPTDQKSGGTKQDQNSTREESATTSYEDADPLHFIFCGPDGISAEDFEALQNYSRSPSPGNYAPPPPRVEATREISANTSHEDGDFIFCGPSGITSDEFEALHVYFESPRPINSAPAPPVRVEAIHLDRRTSSKQKRINRQ